MMTDDLAAYAMGRYQRMRRLWLALLIGVVGIALLFGQSLQTEVIQDAIQLFGLILIIIGIAGRLWAILYIGGRKSSKVIASGPYSVMRNPLYFFSTIAAAGAGAQMGSFAVSIGFSLVSAAALHVVIFREERYLSEKLAGPFSKYMLRVPRFFPNCLLYVDNESVTFNPRILGRTLRDDLVFLLSIPAFEIIKGAQMMLLLPVGFRLY